MHDKVSFCHTRINTFIESTIDFSLGVKMTWCTFKISVNINLDCIYL